MQITCRGIILDSEGKMLVVKHGARKINTYELLAN
jgi:hypothetical protein